MATEALRAAEYVRVPSAPKPFKPPLRRMFEYIVDLQMRRAERVIAQHLRNRHVTLADDFARGMPKANKPAGKP